MECSAVSTRNRFVRRQRYIISETYGSTSFIWDSENPKGLRFKKFVHARLINAIPYNADLYLCLNRSLLTLRDIASDTIDEEHKLKHAVTDNYTLIGNYIYYPAGNKIGRIDFDDFSKDEAFPFSPEGPSEERSGRGSATRVASFKGNLVVAGTKSLYLVDPKNFRIITRITDYRFYKLLEQFAAPSVAIPNIKDIVPGRDYVILDLGDDGTFTVDFGDLGASSDVSTGSFKLGKVTKFSSYRRIGQINIFPDSDTILMSSFDTDFLFMRNKGEFKEVYRGNALRGAADLKGAYDPGYHVESQRLQPLWGTKVLVVKKGKIQVVDPIWGRTDCSVLVTEDFTPDFIFPILLTPAGQKKDTKRLVDELLRDSPLAPDVAALVIGFI